MILQIAIILSVLLQFAAFVIAIKLIPRTKFNIAWISIAIGFLLMALRRLNDLYTLLYAKDESFQAYIGGWIAVVISITMFIASFYIHKIFNLINKLSDYRKQNEAKVLAAIISTEEKERKYFSKELHDGLGPILSSAKMSISAIDKADLTERISEILSKTEVAIDSAIISTKEISYHLNPQILEFYGLEKGIKNFIHNIVVDRDLVVRFDSNLKDLRLSYNVEVILYRISCELINNTLKHASASDASIKLLVDDSKLIFMYEDNGVGFDIDEAMDQGMGLTNIYSRVKSINGRIELKSRKGKGVYVFIELNLK
ncbi:sensor histidine kinase [Plebeiibacterium sediminum]|uniref:histidine kinase n=1 Tax=Plebeiibacterium sediminum TaxID=2992112 RepID=A0AAE3M7A1_9BACT|nr:ATP-binding protein [Plebeiobacterium sediminum]MCW3788109.1 histidine kinase [Plebeiobacterium sediminum]